MEEKLKILQRDYGISLDNIESETINDRLVLAYLYDYDKELLDFILNKLWILHKKFSFDAKYYYLERQEIIDYIMSFYKEEPLEDKKYKLDFLCLESEDYYYFIKSEDIIELKINNKNYSDFLNSPSDLVIETFSLKASQVYYKIEEFFDEDVLYEKDELTIFDIESFKLYYNDDSYQTYKFKWLTDDDFDYLQYGVFEDVFSFNYDSTIKNEIFFSPYLEMVIKGYINLKPDYKLKLEDLKKVETLEIYFDSSDLKYHVDSLLNDILKLKNLKKLVLTIYYEDDNLELDLNNLATLNLEEVIIADEAEEKLINLKYDKLIDKGISVIKYEEKEKENEKLSLKKGIKKTKLIAGLRILIVGIIISLGILFLPKLYLITRFDTALIVVVNIIPSLVLLALIIHDLILLFNRKFTIFHFNFFKYVIREKDLDDFIPESTRYLLLFILFTSLAILYYSLSAAVYLYYMLVIYLFISLPIVYYNLILDYKQNEH